MNKGRRNELTKLKFKKRLKNLQLKIDGGKFWCYKTTGTPCSCLLCSHDKYKRTQKHKNKEIEID